MENVLVIIKIKDSINVLQDKDTKLSQWFVVGENYYEALNVFSKNSSIKFDDDSLNKTFAFLDDYYAINGDIPLVSLYFGINVVAYASEKSTKWNFLNYFAFPYPGDKISDLEKVVTNPIVEYWWTEGAVSLCCDPCKMPTGSPRNTYYKSLKFADFNDRGRDVRIGICEDSDAKLEHPYLPNDFQIQVEGAVMVTEIALMHFYKTAGVLFAVNPFGVKKVSLMGIIPKAKMKTAAFDSSLISNGGKMPGIYHDFIGNFRIRAIANFVHPSQVDLVLLERQIAINIKGEEIKMPLEVLIDIKNIMQQLDEKNIVVIQPIGQYNGEIYNIDKKISELSKAETGMKRTDVERTYSDLTDGSVCVTIGAMNSNQEVLINTNESQLVDVYLWAENIWTTSVEMEGPGEFKPCCDSYGNTSAASAIAAGIVGLLIEQTKIDNQVVTNEKVKCLFKDTFSKPNITSRPDNSFGRRQVFTPFTVKQLLRKFRDSGSAT